MLVRVIDLSNRKSKKIQDLRQNSVKFSRIQSDSVGFNRIQFYVIEWPKPKDIGVPFHIDTNEIVSAETFGKIAEAAPVTFLQARRYYIAQSSVHHVNEGRFQKNHVDRLVVLTSILSISLYGGIHLFAWNLEFPTKAEQLLWRISALKVGIALTISALLVLMEDLTSHRTDRWSKWSVTILVLHVSPGICGDADCELSAHRLRKDIGCS